MLRRSALSLAASAGGPWRNSEPADGVTYVADFVATSDNDAWSTWSACAPCDGPDPVVTYLLERWSGRAWRRVSVPPDISRFLSVAEGVGASSASDLWLFTSGRAAHWNGEHWGIMKIPSWVVRGNLSGTVDLTVFDFGPRMYGSARATARPPLLTRPGTLAVV
jgi:hypothetical protein